MEGAKKIFSIRSLVEFPSTLKVALALLLVWLTLQGNLASFLRIPACGLDCVAPVSGLMLRQLMLVCGRLPGDCRRRLRLRTPPALQAVAHEQGRGEARVQGDGGQSGDQEQAPAIPSGTAIGNLRADVRRSSVIVANRPTSPSAYAIDAAKPPPPLITLKHTDALAPAGPAHRRGRRNPGAATSSAGTALLRDGNVDQLHTGGPDPGHRRSPALAGKPADGYTLNAIGQGGRLGTGNARRCDLAAEKKRGPKALLMLATGQSLSGIPCTTPAVLSSRLLVAVWMNDSSFFCSSAWSGTSW